MVDPISGGILGSLLGGAFRLAPEVLKWLDRKNERQHELSMYREASKLEQLKGDMKIAEIGAQHQKDLDIGIIDAFKVGIQSQTEMVKAAGKGWVASLSASVRPVVTYWILLVWSFVHIWFAFQTGVGAVEVFKLIMSPDFMALVAGTLNYWFLDRTLAKRNL